MSYRELRNFAEMMRALGYQRLVSVENFRSPNFPLVASTLYWMVQRYDPDIVMSDNIETEEARVHFLTKTAEALLNKANIKLNTKNLYMADGHAVRELLKVAKTLYAANEAQEAYKAGEELPDVPSLGTKSKDIRVARQLAADITDRGARLHDLLGHENDVKQDRQAALRFLDTISSNLDGGEHAHVRRSVDALVERCKEDIESAKKACDEYAADERALDAKIKKKKNEWEPVWKSTSVSGDDVYVPARSSGEEPASPRHRAGVASMAWTRRKILISTQVGAPRETPELVTKCAPRLHGRI